MNKREIAIAVGGSIALVGVFYTAYELRGISKRLSALNPKKSVKSKDKNNLDGE